MSRAGFGTMSRAGGPYSFKGAGLGDHALKGAGWGGGGGGML